MTVKSSSVPTFLAIAGIRLGLAVIYECYLVDPASSHMLVSKIKPCMCKYERIQTWPTMVVTGDGELGFDSERSLRNGYHIQGRQQARKLPNPDTGRRTTAKAFAKDVFINQKRKLGARRRSDTVLVSTISDADQGSADVAFRTPLAPYEKSKFLGSGSMVARLKLKGIDGRAPPGVEPAA
ncbi:hypothetical protein Bca101_102222 [Brassica carinata]